MASENANFDDLLNEPRETLNVEIKDWLDLANNDHRAVLAKEIIALANHGGGYVIIGFKEQGDGTFVASDGPETLNFWSPDSIQAVVAKYVDPPFQCQVEHRRVQPNGICHVLISVPGGHKVPVRARAASPDERRLVANRVYVRRPGPNSEEPRTSQDWDQLFERCQQNRQTELIEAFRSILAGAIPNAGPTAPSRIGQLREFEDKAINLWKAKVESLPHDAPPKLVFGYYDASFAIDGQFDQLSLSDLKELIQREVRNHSGWPPFLTLNRPPYTPKPIEGCVEFWKGPDLDGSFDIPAHHDFWRICPDGMLFTRRGFSEDGGFKRREPGKTLDITTPTWRIGECILQASYIAKALNAEDADLICHFKFAGLSGRELVSLGNPNRLLFNGHVAAQSEYEVTKNVSIGALPEALPELVYGVLSPLYELFDFFSLPKRLVEEELIAMQRSRFAV